MSESIIEQVDHLPTGGITVRTLNALDFVIPGGWHNLVSFDEIVRQVTGENNPHLTQHVRDRSLQLYSSKSEGYKRALWLYQTIDSAGTTLGTATLANKISEQVNFLGILHQLTPKADRAQAIDLSLKIVSELLDFCQIHQIPNTSISDFASALTHYRHESLMRMTALICLDSLIPLGSGFPTCVNLVLSNLRPSELEKNQGFKQIEMMIPGTSTASKLGFIQESFNSVQGWMNCFIKQYNLTPQRVVKSLQNFIEVTDDKLDYLAAFLDMATNYYTHTGTQTLARHLIERAYAEI